MSSQELVLSPEFLSLIEDTELCCAEDYFLLTETIEASELYRSLSDFYSACEALTERFEALDEDLVTDAGLHIQTRLDQLSAEYNKLDDIICEFGRYDLLVQDDYFRTYALGLAQEQIDRLMPEGWPFDCMALNLDEAVDSLLTEHTTDELLGTTFHYQG